MRRPLLQVLLSTVAVMASSGCASWGPPRHPDFKNRHAQLQALAILPPHIEAYRITFTGSNEMLYDLLPQASHWAVEELEATLAKRGYAMTPLEADDQRFSDRPELKASLHTIQGLFDKRMEEYQQRWLKGRFVYSVGSEVNVFADLADADALVLLRCLGIRKSAGEMTKDFMKSVLIGVASLGSVMMIPYQAATVIQLAVIDGNTGDILWYYPTDAAPFDIGNEQLFRHAIRKAAKAFPKATSLKAKAPLSSPAGAPARPSAVPVPTVP